jgi:hypothetical protein
VDDRGDTPLGGRRRTKSAWLEVDLGKADVVQRAPVQAFLLRATVQLQRLDGAEWRSFSPGPSWASLVTRRSTVTHSIA